MAGPADIHNPLPPAAPIVPPIPKRVLCSCFRCGLQGKWIAPRTRYNHSKAEVLNCLGLANATKIARIPGVLTAKSAPLSEVLENIKSTSRKRRRAPGQYEEDHDADVDERHLGSKPRTSTLSDINGTTPGLEGLYPPSFSQEPDDGHPGEGTPDHTDEPVTSPSPNQLQETACSSHGDNDPTPSNRPVELPLSQPQKAKYKRKKVLPAEANNLLWLRKSDGATTTNEGRNAGV